MDTAPKTSRDKRINVVDGLKWLLGKEAIGRFLDTEGEVGGATHSLSFSAYPNDVFQMRRRRCPRGEWASAAADEVDENGLPRVEGDRGGWRWEWC